MSNYEDVYEKLFVRNLKRYASTKQNIKRRVDRVLVNPHHNTEQLGDATGRLNLTGCRSARVDKNFRIIFVICEECRNIPECRYCFCDSLPDRTLFF